MTVLQVKQLTARVADHIQFVDVNLSVGAGEIYGILGDAKSGKTEFIQLLSGMRTPDRGWVKVDDCRVHDNIRRAQRHIGVLSRRLALFPMMTVENNLQYWGRLSERSTHRLESDIDRVLRYVHYQKRKEEVVAALGALDRKRVHLAAALLHKPKVLLLDQPTEPMTEREREAFLQIVQKLQRDGQAVVYATDKVHEIQHIATRVAIMDEGKILVEGTVEELRSLLGGQSQIVIRCRPLHAWVKLVEETATVHTVDEEKRELRLWTTKPKELLSRIFSDWQDNGLVAESVRVVEPTLEGVYLHLTGKSLENG
ncbi:hypothetical protein B0W44_06440 [Novibacillus thermophilus]|uniref:ABC transporter domain-containing protein n=1 Tax=Novibacillus thermophilus TaxID=1471761 RepID=A0A1U9K623_9BACL|nr:hypothetical protein B0W44_06440 [Novibacillus thermophilus]